MKDWKEIEKEFYKLIEWQQYKDGTVDALCEPEEILKFIKQLQKKAIDEKIEIYKNILKRFIKEGHDQYFIENKIKDFKEQKNF